MVPFTGSELAVHPSADRLVARHVGLPLWYIASMEQRLRDRVCLYNQGSIASRKAFRIIATALRAKAAVIVRRRSSSRSSSEITNGSRREDSS